MLEEPGETVPIHFDPKVVLHHRDPRERVGLLVQGLLSDAAESGAIRDDIPAAELASYCLHALAAANILPSKAAVRRLVAVTLSGLQRPA